VGRKRTSGTGTVIARSNGTFTAQVSDPISGCRRSVGTFPTRIAAETALATAMVEGPPPTLDQTFAAYLAEWLADRALTVKATTATKDRTLIRRYVMSHPIARVKVRQLKPEHFRRLYRELAERGKVDGSPLSASSVKTLDQTLKSALQQLVDDRVLRYHPIPRRVVKVERNERPWLNLEQVRDLLGFVRFADPGHQDLKVYEVGSNALVWAKDVPNA
jgi:hypothetical protein